MEYLIIYVNQNNDKDLRTQLDRGVASEDLEATYRHAPNIRGAAIKAHERRQADILRFTPYDLWIVPMSEVAHVHLDPPNGVLVRIKHMPEKKKRS